MYHQMQPDMLCESILNLNKNILSTVLINKNGRSVEQISRPKFTEQYPEFTNEMFLMQSVLQVSMGRDFDEKFGPINYYMSERESLTMLTFPFTDHVILVTINKKTSPISIARKVSCLINEYITGHSELRSSVPN